METLKYPSNPQYIVFSDFDETYMAHEMTAERKKQLESLEDFLITQSEEKGILFGWITGSTMPSVQKKIGSRGLRLLPHFIGSALGTTLSYPEKKEIEKEWITRIHDSGYTEEKVEAIVADLAEGGIRIFLQDTDQISAFKKSYYYFEECERIDKIALNQIRTRAAADSINVNISKCNPNAGDPENAYDIDFTPLCCGKKEIVKYLLYKHKLPRSRAYAFGDSDADMAMFEELDHGFLVSNATESAKVHYKKNTPGEYAEGILTVLKMIN